MKSTAFRNSLVVIVGTGVLAEGSTLDVTLGYKQADTILSLLRSADYSARQSWHVDVTVIDVFG